MLTSWEQITMLELTAFHMEVVEDSRRLQEAALTICWHTICGASLLRAEPHVTIDIWCTWMPLNIDSVLLTLASMRYIRSLQLRHYSIFAHNALLGFCANIISYRTAFISLIKVLWYMLVFLNIGLLLVEHTQPVCFICYKANGLIQLTCLL